MKKSRKKWGSNKMETQPTNMRSMMPEGATYGDSHWNKQRELNSGMSIISQEPDEFTNTLKGLGGN